MTDLNVLAPLNSAPLGQADEIVVKRQGDESATRAPASAFPISTATAQALDLLATTAANDATLKADAARGAAISAAATDASSKANAAQSAAATDASSKASAAQAAAISAAATDATAKANAARDSANLTAANTYLPLTARGAAQGVAPLVDGQVPALYLAGAQDEILEFNTFGDFPSPGSTNKMYLAFDTGKLYRWASTQYVEISPSPGSTDDVPEGPSGLRRYFNDERVNAAVLSGMVFNVLTDVVNGDTVRVAIGKLQGRLADAISGFANRVLTTVLSGLPLSSDAQVTAATSVRDGIGRLQVQSNGKLTRRTANGIDTSLGTINDRQLVQLQGTVFQGVDSISDTSYTLATRPPAAGNADEVIRLKNVGNVRSVWQESNGVNWGMQNGHGVITQEAFPASKAFTAAPTTGTYVDLPDSYIIQGGILNENSQVRIRPRFSANQNTSQNQVQVLINGQLAYESTAGAWYQQMAEIRFSNLGALNAQQLFGPGTTGTGFGNSNAAQTAGEVAPNNGSLRSYDTSADLTITFKVRDNATPAGNASTLAVKLAGMTIEVFDR
ncbi:MAG: hypothetical protein C0434_08060 [Xanthomonadaceae bacterium]|nr:hypothetical protein [Xanthomonadaceae bacterium]